jgi:hypothetical protein
MKLEVGKLYRTKFGFVFKSDVEDSDDIILALNDEIIATADDIYGLIMVGDAIEITGERRMDDGIWKITYMDESFMVLNNYFEFTERPKITKLLTPGGTGYKESWREKDETA